MPAGIHRRPSERVAGGSANGSREVHGRCAANSHPVRSGNRVWSRGSRQPVPVSPVGPVWDSGTDCKFSRNLRYPSRGGMHGIGINIDQGMPNHASLPLWNTAPDVAHPSHCQTGLPSVSGWYSRCGIGCRPCARISCQEALPVVPPSAAARHLQSLGGTGFNQLPQQTQHRLGRDVPAHDHSVVWRVQAVLGDYRAGPEIQHTGSGNYRVARLCSGLQSSGLCIGLRYVAKARR